MLKKIKIFYFLWFIATIIATCFILGFEGVRLYDYIRDQYSQESMEVYSIDFSSSSSRRSSVTVNGVLNNEEVYFGLFDDDIIEIDKYLENLSPKGLREFEYKNLKKHNIKVPIVKFMNTNKVILINKKSSLKSTINNWIYTKINILSILYVVLILSTFIKRKLLKTLYNTI